MTAYDVRISDLSSDVCSSDLGGGCGKHARVVQWECQPRQCLAHVQRARRRLVSRNWREQCFQQTLHRKWRQSAQRSEEHTSELQSLMRISYAVFCLKKKNTKRKLQLETRKCTNINILSLLIKVNNHSN